MCRVFHPVAAMALSLSLLGLLPAQASTVTWGAATNISGIGDVSTTGNLVAAVNFGGADTTVNGVLFKSLIIGAPQVATATFGAHALSIVPERIDHTLTNFSTGSAIGGSPFLGLATEYQSLLGSAAGSNFADRDNYLTLGGLVLGLTYEFQAWFNDSDTEGRFAYGLSLVDGQPVGNSVDLEPSVQKDASDSYIRGGTGQFVTGTFVADGSTQALRYARGEIGGGINGFQLRDVTPDASLPEPGSLALVGLALVSAGLLRRAKAD